MTAKEINIERIAGLITTGRSMCVSCDWSESSGAMAARFLKDAEIDFARSDSDFWIETIGTTAAGNVISIDIRRRGANLLSCHGSVDLV